MNRGSRTEPWRAGGWDDEEHPAQLSHYRSRLAVGKQFAAGRRIDVLTIDLGVSCVYMYPVSAGQGPGSKLSHRAGLIRRGYCRHS